MGKPGLDNGGDDGAAAAAGQDPAVQKALTYQPSPEVERRTRQELFDSIVVRIADPATKEKVEQTVTSDALWLQFHQVLTKAGYSTTNLADVTTAYYIIVWEVVNEPDAAVQDRTSVVSGKGGSVRVDLGGRRSMKKKTITS